MSLRLGVWGMKSPNVSLSKVTSKPQTSDSPLSPKAVYGGENAERLSVSLRARPIGYMNTVIR